MKSYLGGIPFRKVILVLILILLFGFSIVVLARLGEKDNERRKAPRHVLFEGQCFDVHDCSTYDHEISCKSQDRDIYFRGETFIVAPGKCPPANLEAPTKVDN